MVPLPPRKLREGRRHAAFFSDVLHPARTAFDEVGKDVTLDRTARYQWASPLISSASHEQLESDPQYLSGAGQRIANLARRRKNAEAWVEEADKRADEAAEQAKRALAESGPRGRRLLEQVRGADHGLRAAEKASVVGHAQLKLQRDWDAFAVSQKAFLDDVDKFMRNARWSCLSTNSYPEPLDEEAQRITEEIPEKRTDQLQPLVTVSQEQMELRKLLLPFGPPPESPFLQSSKVPYYFRGLRPLSSSAFNQTCGENGLSLMMHRLIHDARAGGGHHQFSIGNNNCLHYAGLLSSGVF